MVEEKENLYKFVENLYSKNYPLNINTKLSPFIINRFLSMNRANLKVCDVLNRYTFSLYKFPGLVVSIPYHALPKQSIPFCKYIKGKKEDEELGFWIEALQKYFGWSKRELKENLKCIDDDEKQKLAQFFGFDKTECKKLGVKFEEVIKKKQVESKSLDSWF